MEALVLFVFSIWTQRRGDKVDQCLGSSLIGSQTAREKLLKPFPLDLLVRAKRASLLSFENWLVMTPGSLFCKSQSSYDMKLETHGCGKVACTLTQVLSGTKNVTLLSAEQFAQYCTDLRTTAAWGGQAEVSHPTRWSVYYPPWLHFPFLMSLL